MDTRPTPDSSSRPAAASTDEALNVNVTQPSHFASVQDPPNIVVPTAEGSYLRASDEPNTVRASLREPERERESGQHSSPSDLERGLGGYYSGPPKRDITPPGVTSSQGLGAGLPLPSPGSRVGSRPQSGYFVQSHTDNPFSGSPERSPPRTPGVIIQPRGSNTTEGNRGSQVVTSREDANESIGSRMRHALESERDNIVNRLTATEPQTGQPIGSQVRNFMDGERGHLVDRIPGAYSRTSDSRLRDDPSSRLREVISEEREHIIDQIPGGAHGHAQDEGIGSRLRHAAQDYLHDALPTIPGRIFNPSGGMRGLARNAHSVLDHVVPVQLADQKIEKEHEIHPAGSVSARLSATLTDAQSERDKYASKAQITGLALNVAIGLQVLLGSLTTGLSAVATRGKSSAVATTILGALSTVVASYLARARGSNEPELSITRVKDLEQFIRECKNFENDHGEDMTTAYDQEIDRLRAKFEGLLGNANGERKLSPTGGAFSTTL